MGSGRRWRFAGLGALLALGAPGGLLLLRAANAGEASISFVFVELRADPQLYLYLAASTVIAFTLFGFALGRQADRLDEAGLTDALTGLGNRRLFQERLDHECARAARYAEPLSLLLVDLDGLKEINDRSGHRAGDAVLRRVADVIRDGMRQVDLGARWGGDEFVVLAPRTSAEEAAALAERIRADVERLAGATVSIGVTAVDAPPFDPDTLLRAADAALYGAKQAGRNVVRLDSGRSHVDSGPAQHGTPNPARPGREQR